MHCMYLKEKMQERALLILLGVALLLQCSYAHVRLTFPPARYPDYDFLDNVRTGGPCGIPASSQAATTFQAGSVINVTYHLAYPHRGGIMVNILAPNGSILHALLGTQWQQTRDTTRFYHEVTFPDNFECDRCTLQLVRHAGEWTAPGGVYRFWSCADISIVNSSSSVCNNMTCSGHGKCNQGECDCDRLYSGEFCQNKDECESDEDCNNNGACINIQATSYPRKQCFCNPGWFGEGCASTSSLTDATIDPAEYTLRRPLNDRLTLYARIIGSDEIEVALRHNGTGYVALGWRPQGLSGSCRTRSPGSFPVGRNGLWPNARSFPVLDGADTFYTQLVAGRPGEGGVVEGGSAEGGPEEGGSEEGGSEEGGSEEGGSEEGGSEEGATEEGATEEGATEEGATEEGATEEGATEEGGSEEGGTEEGATEEGATEEGGSEEGSPEEGATEEGATEEGGSEEGSTEEGSTEEGGSEEGGTEEGGTEEGGSEEGGSEEGGSEEGGTNSGTTGGNTHPMDCTDIVIGVARGQRFRVFDYYTRDRSTPRRDSFYGGSDSITAAVGMEAEGFTNIKWRRRLESTGDIADHSITNRLMNVIWSFGQVYPDYFHNPGSGIEAGTAQNNRFYQPDEIKYHGGRNRGATSLNFFDVDMTPTGGPNCRGEYSTGCSGGVCDYRASWLVRGGNVDFTVSARTSDSSTQWVGLGFSDDRMMPNSDAVVGAADSNGFFVTDRFIVARAQPPIDASQDITNAMARHEGGVTTMTFTRPLSSSEPNDLSLTSCRFFLYGWGGSADTTTRTIGYHPSTPIVSPDRICLPAPTECPVNVVTDGTDTDGIVTDGAASVISSLATILMTTLFAVLVQA